MMGTLVLLLALATEAAPHEPPVVGMAVTVAPFWPALGESAGRIVNQSTFGGQTPLLGQLTLVRYLGLALPDAVQLGLGADVGFARYRGPTPTGGTTTATGNNVVTRSRGATLMVVPVGLNLTVRADLMHDTRVPVMLYGRGGVASYIYNAEGSAVAGSTTPPASNGGAMWGPYATLGGGLNLDVVNALSSARWHSAFASAALIAEAHFAWINDFGLNTTAGHYDFSAIQVRFGLAIDF